MVRTNKAANVMIACDVVLMNSGTLPAKNVRIRPDGEIPQSAFGRDASEENKELFLSCFEKESTIRVLQNGSQMSGSFGTTKANDGGFWRYRAEIPIIVTYEDWFDGWLEKLRGRKYEERQLLQILDTGSFTGGMWGNP